MGIKKLNVFGYNKIQVQEVDGVSRSKNVFRQFTAASVFRVISIGLNFLLIPLMLTLLGEERFGVWVTLLSVTSWITMMDIGIGNGLRNKLSESFALNDIDKSKKYISTAYIALAAIMAVVLIISFILICAINWQNIFNTRVFTEWVLKKTIIIVFFAIIINFILSLVNQIINALQRNSLTTLASILANVLMLLALLFFKNYIKNNIEVMALFYSITLLISTIIISILLFMEYPHLIPKIEFFDKVVIRNILNVGLKFFVIQIAGVIIFTTDNIIITQVLGPSKVSGYNITLKVYTTFIMVFGLFMAPLWSAYTEAYIKKDYEWIKAKVRLQNKLILLLIIVVAIVTLMFKYILRLWIHTPLEIPASLPILAGLYAILSIWNNIYGFILGGINKIRLGAVITIFTAAINIPLSVYFSKTGTWGSGGVLIGTIISISVTAVISPLQVYYFIFRSRKTPMLDNLLS